jgi:uncharacterized protein (TIGR04222 family)
VKRALSLVVVAVAALLAAAGPARAQVGEQINRYDVDIQIRRDDSLRITETIDYDFGSQERHGIFRDVPTSLRFDDTYDRAYPLSVVSVQASGGASADFSTEGLSGGLTRIKIGDPDRTTTGRHTYTIVYEVAAALNGFDDHDELYWNAIGPDWEVTIAQATATVKAPGAITEVACFQGPAGATLPCDRAKARGDRAVFAQGPVYPYRGMTVVVALPKGVVAEPSPILRERWSLGSAFRLNAVTGGASGGLLVLVVAGFATLLWTRGRDRRYRGSPIDQVMGNPTGEDQAVPLMEGGRSAPVEFAPPEGLRPGQVGTLIDEQANTLDVTATIVDLAVRGFLLIQELPKEGWFGKPDWMLIRLEQPEDELLTFERKLLNGLFRDANEVSLSSLRATFAERLEGVEESLYVDAVKQGWFSTRPDKVRSSWSGRGVLVSLLGCGLTFVLAKWTHAGLLGIPVIVAGLLLIVGAKRIPARTAKGTAMLRRIRGFRTVIEKAETNMARWAEEEGVFTRYLPFAVVFGCTERWAKAFEGLGQTPDTSWYVSDRPFAFTTFAHAVDGFSVNTGGTIASTPSGSGSSGFSGGGSSGGGGGGGGGGSW